MKATPTVPVRISAKRYSLVRKTAKANGHTISWLMNYVIDLYFQEKDSKEPKFPPAKEIKQEVGAR